MSQDSPRRSPTRADVFVVIALFLVLAAELVLSIRQQSQTFDESVHLFSGYQYWRHRDFGANPEHPPLVKLVAALPLLSLNLKESAVAPGPTKAAHSLAGVNLLYRNDTDAETILFRTRLAASVFTFLLAALVLLCGYEMLGPVPALLGLAILVFDPNILANGALVTTDIGETCFLFASVYTLYRYVKKPSPGRVVMCGFTVALALAAKHSGLVVTLILVLLAISELLSREKEIIPLKTKEVSRSFAKRTIFLAAMILVIFAIGCAGLWAFYTFRYAARPEGAVLSPTLDAFAHTLRSGMQTKLVLALAHARLLPESYLWGLTDVLRGAEGRAMFLLGKVYATGQWFYFPLVFLMKSTLGFIVLLMAFPLVARRLGLRRELLFLVIPPVVFFGISMLSGMNLGMRHILPILPFLILIAAATASSLAARSKVAACTIGMIMLAHAASSLHAYPNYLTYSNEVVGGPSKTHRVMSDANTDWGQGLKQAATYLAEHHVTDCWFAYRIPFIDLDWHHIPCKAMQSGSGMRVGMHTAPFPPTVEGTVLVSANEAAGHSWGPGELNPYKQFFDKQPDDIIANSILVFHGSFDVSLAAAANHAGRARQLLAQKQMDAALIEAQTAAQLSPGSAEMQATLCQVLLQMGRKEEGQQTCQNALSIAKRVYPEYQFLRVKAIQEIAAADR
jgi:hypothetical protein